MLRFKDLVWHVNVFKLRGMQAGENTVFGIGYDLVSDHKGNKEEFLYGRLIDICMRHKAATLILANMEKRKNWPGRTLFTAELGICQLER